MCRKSFVTLLLAMTPMCMVWGCIGFYRYYPTEITVVDSETRNAVEGLAVATHYSFDPPGIVNPPKVEGGTTDHMGKVTLPIASWKQTGLKVGDRYYDTWRKWYKTGGEMEEMYFSRQRNKGNSQGFVVTLSKPSY